MLVENSCWNKKLYYMVEISPTGQSMAVWPSGYCLSCCEEAIPRKGTTNVKGERLEIFYHIGA